MAVRPFKGLTAGHIYIYVFQRQRVNFHVRTVQRLDIIKVLLIHQLMHQGVVLKNNIKIYIKTAPTRFSVTVNLLF